MKNPDAIVIGAGVVGACTALSLVNAGLKVLVIDRGPVASGTTGAADGPTEDRHATAHRWAEY